MKPTTLTLIAILLILGSAASYVGFDLYRLGKLSFISSPIQAACHSMVADRMKSPSSLKIISSDQIRSALDYEQSKQAIRELNSFSSDPELYVANFEMRWPEIQNGERSGPLKHQVLVQYDASNGFGAILRESAVCEMFTDSDAYPSATHMSLYMKLDGKTDHDWKMELVKSLN